MIIVILNPNPSQRLNNRNEISLESVVDSLHLELPFSIQIGSIYRSFYTAYSYVFVYVTLCYRYRYYTLLIYSSFSKYYYRLIGISIHLTCKHTDCRILSILDWNPCMLWWRSLYGCHVNKSAMITQTMPI